MQRGNNYIGHRFLRHCRVCKLDFAVKLMPYTVFRATVLQNVTQQLTLVTEKDPSMTLKVTEK